MTHLQILEPTIDSLEGKHFQHTVVTRNSTSLQTSPSRQALKMTCPPRHTTSWIHLDRKTKSHLTRLHHPRYCAQSVQHTILCRLRQIEPCGPFQSSCFLKKVLVIPSATQLCYDSCVPRIFLVPASTICPSSCERRAFWRWQYPRISNSKKV